LLQQLTRHTRIRFVVHGEIAGEHQIAGHTLDAQLVKAIARAITSQTKNGSPLPVIIKSPATLHLYRSGCTNQRLELMSWSPSFKAAKDVAILVKEAAGRGTVPW